MKHLLVVCVAASLCTAGASAKCDTPDILTPAIGGADGFPAAMTWWDPDGDGPARPILVMAGSITSRMAGGVSAQRAAAWDGHTWTCMDANLQDLIRSIDALGVVNHELLAAGRTDIRLTTNRLVRWTGSSWETVADTSLHLIGRIASWRNHPVIASAWTSEVAVLENGSFQTLGAPLPSGILALAEYGDDLFAVAGRRLRRWNGSSWEVFGPADGVQTASTWNDSLYIGGTFTSVPGIAGARGILRWDGAAWGSVADGLQGSSINVNQLSPTPGGLLVLGGFSAAGGVPAVNAALWDGLSWRSASPPGTTSQDFLTLPSLTIDPIARGDTPVVAASSIMLTSGTRLHHGQAMWDGSAWVPLGEQGLAHPPSLVAAHNGRIYIAGGYDLADQAAEGVAVLTDGRFEQAGSLRGQVTAMVSWNDTLIAAGTFSLDGTPASNLIARLDGDHWTALGGTWNLPASTLLPDGETLLAGGPFTRLDGMTLRYLARWNGSAWSALTAPRGEVSALARWNGRIVAASPTPDTQGRTIQSFDGSAWTPLGGMTDGALALAADGESLYAAGATAGIFQLLAGSWTQIANGNALALSTRRGDLYANLGGRTILLRSGAIVDPAPALQAPFALLGDDAYSAGTFVSSCGAPAGLFARFHCPCAADINGDGFLDFFDYDDFVAAFETGGPAADFNRDGFTDFFDYADFITAFESGC